MASISEWIVKEYFEMLGYMTSQPCKYYVIGRSKRLDEEIDFIISDPLISEQKIPENILWSTEDLKGIAYAVVGVYGWHTDRIYPAMIRQLTEICRFASQESIRQVSHRTGTTDIAKILCLTQLPASVKLRDETLSILKQKGIDGVLPFRTMLMELINRTDIRRNYEKSDILQVIRILKNYDLLKDTQMDFFAGKRRRRPRKNNAEKKT